MSDVILRAEAIASVLRGRHSDLHDNPLAESLLSCCRDLLASGEPHVASELLNLASALREGSPDDWAWRVDALRVETLSGIGSLEQALNLARTLIYSASDVGRLSQNELFHVRIAEGRELAQLNRVDEAIECLLGVRRELLGRPDSAALARCTLQISNAALVRGDIATARRFTLEAIVSSRRSNMGRLESLALGNLAIIEKLVCRWASALEALQEKETLSSSLGQRNLALQSRHSRGIILWKLGRTTEALAITGECEDGFKLIGNDLWHWYSCLLNGMIRLHAGDYVAAREDFTSEPKWEVPQSQSRPSLLTSEFLGDIHLEQGEAAPALKLYDEVFPKAMALVPKGDIVAELRRRRAECYLLLDRHEDAYTEAQTGLEHCRELGDRYEEAATYRVLALAAAALGNAREARQLFEQGFSFYEDIETPFEWGKLWMSYGDWLSGPNAADHQELRGALEAYVVAREHFERMGARAKLALVNAKFQGVSAEISAREASKSSLAVADSASATIATTKRRPHRTRADRELDERSAWALESFDLITRHRPLLHLLGQVEKLSKSRSPVLILGESGTGKELVARGVHRLSGRKAAYLPLNCGAIPRDVMESELFGHVAGAFTGALRDKPGLFEVCDQGTVFLDEIGEINLDLQSKLLRFLETGESRRVDATKNIESDVRIVAATNRERAALEKGQGFRVDLYYRLAHAVVELPPLRGRGQDVELLIEHFFTLACRAESRNVRFSDEAMDRLIHHSWPGNIRQLRGVIEHAVLVSSEGEVIGPEHLQLTADRDVGSFEKEMEMVERRKMEEALRQHRGSKAEAARSLRMPRTTFLAKMKRYGMA